MDVLKKRPQNDLEGKVMRNSEKGEGKTSRFYSCSRPLYCQQLTQHRPKQWGAAGSTAVLGRNAGTGEPACTKLMGNCSDWLLPSLEQGLEEGKGEGRAEVHEMGGNVERTPNAPR